MPAGRTSPAMTPVQLRFEVVKQQSLVHHASLSEGKRIPTVPRLLLDPLWRLQIRWLWDFLWRNHAQYQKIRDLQGLLFGQQQDCKVASTNQRSIQTTQCTMDVLPLLVNYRACKKPWKIKIRDMLWTKSFLPCKTMGHGH
jgi:hypothetical protein